MIELVSQETGAADIWFPFIILSFRIFAVHPALSIRRKVNDSLLLRIGDRYPQ